MKIGRPQNISLHNRHCPSTSSSSSSSSSSSIFSFCISIFSSIRVPQLRAPSSKLQASSALDTDFLLHRSTSSATMAPALAPKERAQKAFSEIDSHRALLASCTTEWKELEDHFSELEKSLEKKLEELADKEKSFEEKTNEAKLVLDKREEAISVREQASLARVQEQKDAAIAALAEERRRYLEGGLPKASESVTPAETAAAVTKLETTNEAMDVDVPTSKAEAPADANGATKASKAKPAAAEVRVRPEVKSLCENMDGEGLRKYIVDHRKDIGVLRNEFPSALQCAIDPCRLVLKALEGYHLLELDPSHAKETGASANRRACILLLECLAQVLADPALGVDHPVVPSNIKESAKEVANRWRSKRDIHAEAVNDNSLDAQAFLQLLATFGIASEFNDDELLKLVTAVARRKQTPALCRSLGLTAKIPDLVDQLNKDGKQIEALSFAHFFEIMDKVQPVPMLKAYLKEARKAAQSLAKNAPSPAAAQNDSTMKELSAIKAVLRAVEEYKLSSQYPTEGLQKRVAQLEKSKADRKRAATTGKTQTQSKRPRPTAGHGGGYGAAAPATHSAADRQYYVASDRGQYGGAGIAAYGLASQSAYERRPQASYSSIYGAGSRSPGSLGSSYLYSADAIGSSAYAAASAYSNPSATYGTYQYGNGLPPTSAYQSTYLR